MSTLTTDHTKDSFIQAFRPTTLNGSSVALSAREAAENALSTLSLPTKKTEAWKYTQLKSLLKQSYQLPQGYSEIDSIEPYLIPGLEADRLVFINGTYAPEWSDLSRNGEAIQVSPISELTASQKSMLEAQLGTVVAPEDDIFAALNTAFAKEGTLIQVLAGKVAPAPVYLLHLTQAGPQASLSQSRNLFVVEKGAEAQVIASHHTIGEGHSLSNTLTEIVVGDNAGLEYVNFQLESAQASRIERTEVRQGNDSRCSVYTFTFRGDLIRNQLTMWLDGQNTESNLMGAYLLSGQQHVDNHTQVHHLKPNCYSNELYKGIIDEQATAVFSGKIHVYEDAQKTNAYQSNRNILLSDTANMYTQPQLEIYADDVKCSHGATTGRLDKEAMFYLKARGIKDYDARIMLIYAFAMEVAEKLKQESLKDYVSDLISNRF